MRSFKKLCLVALLGSFCFASCVSTKKRTAEAIYFKNISDSLLLKTPVEYEPIIQKGDIVSIRVITANENSSRLFNAQNATGSGAGGEGSGGGQSGLSSGYLVDEKGTIMIPYIGNVKAAGLSRLQLTESITEKLRNYIDSAIVSIRLLNYRITILGEVAKPGTYTIPSERVSVIDAIGLAGDLTMFGKRNNIRIIRNTDGIKQTGTIDLNNGDIFGSPYFYLQQNDIVYVEMNDRKVAASDQTSLRGLTIGLGIISAVGVIVSIINVLR